MSSHSSRKKQARRHQATTGDSYTRSRRLTDSRNGDDSAPSPYARESVDIHLGLQADGSPLTLTLSDNGRTHGIIIGSTGSGKSTLLQTVVFRLCDRYPPEAVMPIIVENKPVSTFADFKDYPHLADIASATEPTTYLRALINQRCVDAKELGSISLGVEMPRALVIIDDFNEVIQDDDDFEVVIKLMRLGRSLGIHVLLVGQHLYGARGLQLLRHAWHRVALRTMTEQDSQDVIGTAAVAHVPPEALGSGFYCCTDPDAAPVAFQTEQTPRSQIRDTARRFTEG